MRGSVQGFVGRGEVRGTGKLQKTTADINMSQRMLRLKVVNDIVHVRCKHHDKMSYFSVIISNIHKEMVIWGLIIVTTTCCLMYMYFFS